MRIDWLTPVLDRPGSFATVYIDATRSPEAGDRETESRWRAVRRELEHEGAPTPTLDALEAAIARPTWEAGPRGRVLIAQEGEVLVDRTLGDPPPVTQGVWGRIPRLWEVVRAADEVVEYVLVIVDRRGADLFWTNAGAGSAVESVIGGHDEIHKAHASGTSQRRAESRAEDSWERNAEQVAADLDRQVEAHRPEVVLLAGDVRAVGLVRAALGRAARELVVEVAGGSRGAGVNEAAFSAHLGAALDGYRDRRRHSMLERFRERAGRESGAVTSLEDVVAVLRRGQVAELLVSRDGLGDRVLWVGDGPLDVALSRVDVEGENTEEIPATAALVRAGLGQDAGLTLVPGDGLIDGVGAILRWADAATPAEVAATMSGDDARLG